MDPIDVRLTRMENLLENMYTADNPEDMHRYRKNLLPWVGGYAHGRTEKGDPFIWLFSPNDKVIEKWVRVYDDRFKYLPEFIDTDVPANTPKAKANPDKNALIKMRRYKECPMWKAILLLGDKTNLGRPEIRYGNVYKVTSSTKHYKQQAQPQPETRPQTAVSQPEQLHGDERPGPNRVDMWMLEAQKAKTAVRLDQALLKLEPDFRDVENVARLRGLLFAGSDGFDSSFATSITTAMLKYAEERGNGLTHADAKAIAHKKFVHGVPIHLNQPPMV